MKPNRRTWMPSLILVTLSACAAGSVEDEDSVDSIEQAIGETTCPGDYTFNLSIANTSTAHQQQTSPSAYGDKYCQNAFTGLAYFQPSTTQFPWLHADYSGPDLVDNAPFPCGAAYVRAVVWHWSGSSWVQVADNTVYGTEGYRTKRCVVLPFNYVGPKQSGAGEYYAISAQAGIIYTQEPVTVAAFH